MTPATRPVSPPGRRRRPRQHQPVLEPGGWPPAARVAPNGRSAGRMCGTSTLTGLLALPSPARLTPSRLVPPGRAANGEALMRPAGDSRLPLSGYSAGVCGPGHLGRAGLRLPLGRWRRIRSDAGRPAPVGRQACLSVTGVLHLVHHLASWPARAGRPCSHFCQHVQDRPWSRHAAGAGRRPLVADHDLVPELFIVSPTVSADRQCVVSSMISAGS
jgi:hypothetical protein